MHRSGLHILIFQGSCSQDQVYSPRWNFPPTEYLSSVKIYRPHLSFYLIHRSMWLSFYWNCQSHSGFPRVQVLPVSPASQVRWYHR